MPGILLPAATAAFAAGLLAAPALGSHAPVWGWILPATAGLVGAAIAGVTRAVDAGEMIGRVDPTLREPPAPEALRRHRAASTGSGAALVLALLGLWSLGVGWGTAWVHRVDGGLLASAAPDRGHFEGALRSDPRPGPYGWWAIADIGSFAPNDGGNPVVARDRVWLSGGGEPPAGIVRGDRIAVEGTIERPQDRGFATMLQRRGIAVALEAEEVGRIGPSSNPFVRAAQAFRAGVGRSLRSLFPEREAGLLMGLALGDDTGLDPALERDFDAAGLGHLLVASGGNVAIALIPAFWLAAVLALPLGVRLSIGAVVIGAVVLVTGGEPSVLRAGVMATLALIGAASGRPRATGSLVAGAVLLLLVFDPTLVWSIGFQLSVAATAGLAAFAGPIAERLPWAPTPVALAVGATVGAQLGVTPLLLFHFHEVPGSTVFANLAAFPLVAPSMLLGLAAAAVGSVVEPAGALLAAVASFPLHGLEVVADRAAKAPVPAVASGGGTSLLVLGTSMVAAIAWRIRTGRPFPRLVPLAAAVAAPTLAWWVALGAGPPDALRVRFFDVGQGDAALVTSPGGANVLIDGGPDADEVASRLAAMGVRRLDVVVASHPHADHIVGLPAVLARFPVGVVLEPGCPDEEGALRPGLLDAIADERLPLHHPRAGASYQVGDLGIDVLSPTSCYAGTESDLNNDALVLRIRHPSGTVLFATEPEEPAQEDMLEAGVDLRADVMKVPHHGAATSIPEFFEAVHASVAVVSVGENPYGHPVGATLDALAATGARVVRTDEEGDVVITLDDGGVALDA